MNLKIRINLIITLILALVMLAGAWMTIDNARDDIRAEVDSTTVLALHLLDSEVLHYTTDYAMTAPIKQNKVSIFRLQSLDNVRHLRIEFFDANGKLIDSNRFSLSQVANVQPFWFKKLINKVSTTLKPTHRSILVNGHFLGELVITPDPSYEIAEIWHDTVGFLGLGMLFFLIVNGVVYISVGSALRPLSKILEALTKLEHGALDARLPLFSLPELSKISQKFNTMAKNLEDSISNNHRLTQQIIGLQEEERKSIAQDLHDEIGQHLTAINIDAAAILKAKDINATHESAKAISEVVMQMMGMVRAMLQRLRPAILDELGLKHALTDLIDTWSQRNRDVKVNISAEDSLENIDQTVAIAAYRVIQECLTNVSKHSRAHQVFIHVEKRNEHLHISVQDDGQGFDANLASKGFGLAGMRERVKGLDGEFQLITYHQFKENLAGVLVRVRLPVNQKGQL
jgi:two-component system sensor histidine kinase UhpB